MLPRLWIYNYDFEFELAGKKPVALGKKHITPWYFLNRSAFLFLPLIAPTDKVLCYRLPDRFFLDQFRGWLGFLPRFLSIDEKIAESNAVLDDVNQDHHLLQSLERHVLIPWGYSPKLGQLSVSLKAETSISSNTRSILQANSKKSSDDFRNQLLPREYRIPSRQILERDISLEDLKTAVTDFKRDHPELVVKHFFGTSGQLSDLSLSTNISSKQLVRWQSWIRQSGGILLEKFEKIHKEYSMQVEISGNKKITPLAMTRMLSNRNGSYLGNLFNKTICQKLESRFPVFLPILKQLAERGYEGPIGMDLMETRDGSLKLVEINARFTMGRIAFEWNKLLNQHDVGVFVNFFLRDRAGSGTNDLFNQGLTLKKKYNCSLSILNHIRSEQTGNSLVTALLGAHSTNSIQAALLYLFPILYQRIML